MTHIIYTLSMPNVRSWNGKWTGAEKTYCVGRSYPKKSEALARVLSQPSFYYNFGDGWGASVRIEKVDAKEKTKRVKHSAGFCGYDWMIDSIEKRGIITTSEEA